MSQETKKEITPMDIFNKIVNETVEEAFNSGIQTFMENLEQSLEKDAIFESYGLDGVVNHLIQEAVGTTEEPVQETQEQSVPEDALDQALAELEKEFPDLE